jgi:hypothetical protein
MPHEHPSTHLLVKFVFSLGGARTRTNQLEEIDMIIGLSVSGCIREMAAGKVDPASVTKIIGRTACWNPTQWDEILAMYRKYPWEEFPEKAEQLAREFIAAGKVEQPRLDPVNPRWVIRKTRLWVKSERHIRYELYPYQRILR